MEQAMHRPQPNAPLHAKILSVFWGVTSCHGLLRLFHVLPSKYPHTFAPEHLLFHQLLAVSEFTLVLVGAVFLWKMRPVAAKLFLANLALTVSGSIYLTFISPDSQMILLRHKSYFLWIFVLGLLYGVGQFLYVWWVTSLRTSTNPEAEPSGDKNAGAPTAAKIISVLYGVVACLRILALFHILPSRFGARITYAEHPALYHLSLIAGAVILLPAAVFLWKMRPIAARLFLAYLVLSTFITIYLTRIAPDTQMLRDFPFVTLLRFVVGAAVCAYVWSVTSPRRPALND